MFTPHSTPGVVLPPPIIALLVVVGLVLYVWVLLYFVQDLYRPERRVAGGDKTFWLVVMVVGSFIGILAYLYVGREG